MKNPKTLSRIFSIAGLSLCSTITSYAQEVESGDISSILQVQQYDRAIHIMAMLLIGFGFLMVFVKKYGRSALTATFLLVSIALPMYMSIKGLRIFEARGEIEQLILAEFGAASLLIAAEAILGRIKIFQYLILGLLFVPFYILNELIVIGDYFHFVGKVADTGGSIVIYAFGALFGIAAAIAHTVVNVFIALCGSTIATYFASVLIRGKVCIADIANAALAGGVAIGATCDFASHAQAMVIGVIAGAISTVGFAVLQDKQQKFHRIIDTCGVSNLHGLPGIFGGLAAILVIEGLDITSQIKGIVITVVIAIIAGLLSSKIISLIGRSNEIYNDCAEFKDAEEKIINLT
jgi:ammonium transporter Rh